MSMNELINSAKRLSERFDPLPFSIYSSVRVQRILNVPIVKPLLILILDGRKQLGSEQKIICPTGSFVFLSNSPGVDMRNIPDGNQYFALLIEFDPQDFQDIPTHTSATLPQITGNIDPVLEKTLLQFVDWSSFAPEAMWSIRKKEILLTLYHLGYQQIGGVMTPPSLSYKIHQIVSDHIDQDINASFLCSSLAMSESTLRRKLNSEGTTLQEIKDHTRLGLGLHLVQTTPLPIGIISERCGYQSQSRFTDKFKQLFKITPTELRKTRLID